MFLEIVPEEGGVMSGALRNLETVKFFMVFVLRGWGWYTHVSKLTEGAAPMVDPSERSEGIAGDPQGSVYVHWS